MKPLFILFAAGTFLFSTASYGAETAHARLYCLSPQFQEATAYDSYGFQWRLDLTTLSSGDHGELALDFFNSGYTHSTYIDLYSELYEETDPGAMVMNVPDGGDANGNGFPDFWEVSQGVNGLTSAGVIQCRGFGINYNLTATWHRDAGSATGTCALTFHDPSNPFNNITFVHSFELIEYTGPLTYMPGSNTVSATVNLAQTGNPANTLQGPIIFDKSVTDRFNTLTNEHGVWINAALQMLPFDNEVFIRDPRWPTNYAGYVFYADGDPNTVEPDYQVWVLSIDDTNDTNANGIPDFSDDPAVALPPRAPRLSLAPGATNLWLTISGDVGHTNDIQELDSLTATNWQTTLSLTLTNDPQVVSLSLPSVQMKFWRVLAR
jgi:hypothetical protein